MAKERNLTTSRAPVELAQRDIEAETQTGENLSATYHRFMSENDPALKGQAGKELIRAIFGTEAVADKASK